MSKISREDNKKRFKTGMYPTQQDFENVFDSYVHKDDTIDPSKIVSGDENIVDIINRKAEKRHNHPISEVDNLSETLQQIQDDLDTAEDNIAGHETRIVTLEAAKTDYEAFKERVRAFLEDANASDTTIDRWHEIENFLQGITDTETLTGLLNDLKQEILGSIPEPQTGNYLELVDDLDAYTDAPDGKIVKYVGQTNEKYTRGFDYEKKQGYSINLQPYSSYVINVPEGIPNTPSGLYWTSRESPETITESVSTPTCLYETGDGTQYKGCAESIIAVGDVLFSPTGSSADTIPSAKITAINKNQYGEVELLTLQTGETLVPIRNSYSNRQGNNVYVLRNVNGEALYSSDWYNYGAYNNGVFRMYGGVKESVNIVEINETEPSSWQPIPSFNVIN